MAGYTGKFILPVIAPPATSSANYYPTVASKVQVTSNPPGVSITVTDPSLTDLLAMCGGSASVVRSGEQLPDSTAAVADSVLMIIGPADWQALDARLPLGYPVPTWFIYGGVDLAEVEKALKPVVDALDDAVLKYDHPPPVPSDHATLVQDYLARVLGGQQGVFVRGGTPIGRGSGGTVLLRLLDADNVDLPIGLYFERWTALNAALAGHPLVTAAASLPKPARQAHVRFETWDLGRKKYVSVPGLTLKLMDQKTSAVVTSGTTAEGATALPLPGGWPPTPIDAYFVLAAGPGVMAGGRTLPAQWSTETRYSKDGGTGLFRKFAGFALGTAAKPLVYRVGIDLHLQVEFWVPTIGEVGPQKKSLMPLPPGKNRPTRPFRPQVKVDVRANGSPLGDRSLGTFVTDNDIRIDKIIDDNPAQDLYFTVELAIEDPAIQLGTFEAQSGLVTITPIRWKSGAQGKQILPGGFFIPSFRGDHVGDQGNPQILVIQDDPDYAAPAAHALCVIRELHEWLFRMSNQDWQGVPGLNINLFTSAVRKIPGTSHSFPTTSAIPNLNLHLENIDFWRRDQIAHEYAHQVMWRLAGVTLLSFPLASYKFDHWWSAMSNNTHALLDGWAEFIELIFGGGGDMTKHNDPVWPDYDTWVKDKRAQLLSTALDALPDNDGMRVEGAVARAFYDIYKEVVLGLKETDKNPTYPETANGDWRIYPGTEPLEFKDKAYAKRFVSIFWQPMKDMVGRPLTVQEYLLRMKLRNSAPPHNHWPQIEPIFHRWNIIP